MVLNGKVVSWKMKNSEDFILWILGILFVLVLFLKCVKTHIFIKYKQKLCAVLIFSLNLQTCYMATVLKQKKEGYIFLFNKKPWKLHGVESLGNPLFLWKNVIGEIGDWHHNEQNIVRADTDCQLEFGLRHWLLSAWCLPSKEDGRCKTESFLSLVNVVYTSE